jgi:HD-GYP domain-containing protein (c-di-GMP phosphodiesterase class II)
MQDVQDTGVIPRLEEMLDLDHAFYIDYSRVRRHQIRVMEISAEIGRILGLDERKMEILGIAARLHDYGKRIWTPEMIFKKKEKMDEYERDLVYTHPVMSANLIRIDLEMYDRCVFEVFSKYYSDVFRIIECHHENYDGSGYPFGLKSGEMPFESEIIHSADAYDAMRSPRLYRGVKHQLISHEAAIRKMKEKSGIEFHPKVAAAFLRIPKEWLESIHESVNSITERKITEMYGYEISRKVTDH